MKDYDITLYADGNQRLDLNLDGCDLALGNTLQQNLYLILVSYQGEWKSAPTLGVGIESAVGDHDVSAWRADIREHLKRDGLTVGTVEYDTLSEKLNIKASYTS